MMPPEPDRTWLRNAALLTTAGVILFAVLTVLFIDLIAGNGTQVGADENAVPPASPIADIADMGNVDPGQASIPESIDEADDAGEAEPMVGANSFNDGSDDPESDGGAGTEERAADDAEGTGQSTDVDDPPQRTSPGDTQETASVDPSSNVPFPDPVISSTDLETFRDADEGFFFQLPPSWRRARIAPDLDRDPQAADYDVVFESPDGAQRIAVSVWDAAERAAFPAWVMSVAGGMRAVDGEYPTNAFIAGEPALVVGEAESPTSPLRYAAFLAKEDRYVRIAWSAPTGAVRATDYLRALATFQWPDVAAEGSTTETVESGNQAPPLRLPAGLYFPSDSLFTDAETAADDSADR